MKGRPGEIGVFLGLVGLLVALFWPASVAVELAAVSRGRVPSEIVAEGRVRHRELYVVAAPVAGQLRRIPLKPGDAVLAGETVALLQPTLPEFLDERTADATGLAAAAAEAAAEAAEAAIALADARLRHAETRRRRSEFLTARGVETLFDRELARTALAARRADLAAAQADRLAARHAVARLHALRRQPRTGLPAAGLLRVTAPASGRVLQVLEASETPVAPGVPLLVLGDAADLEVVVELASEQLAGLRPGQPVTLERWGGPTLPGRLSRIEPAGQRVLSLLGFEEQRVRVIVDILAPPAAQAGLAHGFRVDLRFALGAADGLVVPVGALVRQGDAWTVFVAADGTARRRVIRLGRRGGGLVEVLEGLLAGEQVVVHPGEHVADGVALRPR